MYETGVTQAEIARECKIKPPSVADWLNGKTKNLKGPNLVKTARLLRVEEAWLADGVGPKERKAEHWPFSTSYDAYNALDDDKKQTLDNIVTAFLSGVAPRKSDEEKAA
jgi:transcriptional regulator with XRE-family HTH domain